jgi:hypothetical protein
LANVLSIRSFLRRRSGRRDKIHSEEKRTKILTWFNFAAVAAGTKGGIEEDEEEAESVAVQIGGILEEPMAPSGVHEEQS